MHDLHGALEFHWIFIFLINSVLLPFLFLAKY